MEHTLIERLNVEMSALSVFKSVLDAPAVKSFRALLAAGCGSSGDDVCKAIDLYAWTFCGLVDAGFDSLGGYLFDFIKYEENPLSKAVCGGCAGDLLLRAAARDLEIVNGVSGLSCARLKGEMNAAGGGSFGAAVNRLPEWKAGPAMTLDELCAFYRENGSGVFARSRAVRWDGERLHPAQNYDRIAPGDMLGYEWQRKAVYDNTRALLGGLRVNNILLFGDSGTGKSATVKSMLGVPEFKDLRIVEADKRHIRRLPSLMRKLGGYGLKFVVYIDDLSFEQGDAGFSDLKIILEGGVERRPANTAIYATSNRRQLVKRSFADARELDPAETVQEQTSLADRFGIRIPYMALSKAEYLDMVGRLAARSCPEAPKEELMAAAVKWELEHAGRTPRTAVQFIDYIRSMGSELT